MKILLNKWDDPRVSECAYVGKGDKVFAGYGAVEFGFTLNKEYEILDIEMFEFLVLKNDNGVIDSYTTEYFNNYKSI